MKISKYIPIVLAACLTALSASHPAGAAAASPAGLDQACRRAIVLLLDVSGSFGFVPEAVESAKGMIVRLRAGDCFVARTIGSSSFAQRDVLVLRLPLATRAIDPTFRRRLASLKAQAASRMTQVLAAPRESNTDIRGALLAAGQTLAATPAEEKILLLYSDLKDTEMGKKKIPPFDLRGVQVAALFVERDEDPSVFVRRIAYWQGLFEKAGASRVAFFDTGLMPIAEVQP